MPLTLPDLITSLRRQAAIAATTDRAVVLAEAAERLEALAADGERLDWIVSRRTQVTTAGVYPGVWFCHTSQGKTIRDAIDKAMREGNADA